MNIQLMLAPVVQLSKRIACQWHSLKRSNLGCWRMPLGNCILRVIRANDMR